MTLFTGLRQRPIVDSHTGIICSATQRTPIPSPRLILAVLHCVTSPASDPVPCMSYTPMLRHAASSDRR